MITHRERQVDEALSSAQQHGEGLRAVNDKLAELVASLREHRRRLVDFSTPGSAAAPVAEGQATGPDLAQRTVVADLALAREALEHSREQEERVRERLTEIQEENRRLCDEFAAVHEQHFTLVFLYAAVERLHEAPDRAGVLAAIAEIVVNMVGSEELALFERSLDGGRLAPSHTFGVQPESLDEITCGSGTLGRAVAAGVPFLAGEEGAPGPPDARDVTACIPLKLGGEVTAALVVYRLVPHKHALTARDRSIFGVLEKHAAVALHTAALRQRGAASINREERS